MSASTLRRVLAAVLAIIAIALAVPATAGAQLGLALPTPDLGVLGVTWHTELRRPDGTRVVRDTLGVLNVPTPIDVDRDGLPELTATLQALSLQVVSVKVERLPGVSEAIPASVEAVVGDPSGGALPRDRIAVGYDARDSDAPRAWETDLRLVDVFGDPDPVRLGVDVLATAPAAPLAVLAELFDVDAAGRRVGRIGGRLAFDPVPGRITTDLAFGDRIDALVNSSTASRLDVLARLQKDDTERRVEATIDELPGQVRIGFEETGPDQRRLDYDGSAAIERLQARVTDRRGAPLFETVERTVEATVLGIPQGITVRQDGPEHVRLTTRGGAIGRIDGSFASGGDAIAPSEEGHALRIVQDAGVSSVAFRVLGLERATVSGGVNMLLDAVLAPGRFRAEVSTPEVDLDAIVRDVPRDLRLLVDLAVPRVIYDGNGTGIEEIAVKASSPKLFGGRATRLEAAIRYLPAVLQLDVRRLEAGGADIVADNAIGAIELLLSSGPGERLPAGEQGVILRDAGERLILFGRVFGLRRVRIAKDPLNVRVEGGAGLPFRAYATIEQPGEDFEATAVVDKLPRTIELTLEDAAGTRLRYDADAPIERLTLEAHGLALLDRGAHARVAVSSVPAQFEVALPDEGALLQASASDPIGTIELQLAGAGLPDLPPAGRDGLLFVDTPARFALAGRISRLRAVEVRTDPDIDATLDLPGAALPFDFAVEQQESEEVEPEFLRGTIDAPQARTHLVFSTAGEADVTMTYSAAAPVDLIDLDTNAGGLGRVDATLRNLPRALSVCFDSGRRCDRIQRPVSQQPLVSIDVDDHGTAEVPIRIDGSICVRPDTADCLIAPRQVVRITALRLRELGLSVTADGLGGTGAFLDTDNNDTSGQISYRDDEIPIIAGVDVNLPAGFRANDRSVGLFEESGSIACPDGGGTDLTLVITGLPDIDLASLLCGDAQ